MGEQSPIGKALKPGHRAISSALLSARREARGLPGVPGQMPETLEEAYAIQDASRAEWQDSVAGWKVGGIPSAYLDRFDAKSLAGPIWSRSIKRVGTGRTAMPVFEGGFAAIEPEFVFELGASRDADRLYIGAEIASSPIPAINDHGPVAVICDFGNNNGLLLGAEIENWRDRSDPVIVTTTIDGEIIATKTVDDFPATALDAVNFLIELAESRGFDLPPGAFVSSGAITGVHEAAIGAVSTLDFGDLGRFDLELVAATPV